VVSAALSLGRPGTVLVLVPSIGWARRLTVRLQRRGVAVAADWAEARAGWPVVVGTRTAAWAPIERLAAAVVLDAHDPAYTSGWPGFDAAEVVAERAARDGAPCVLVSPCPTVVQVEGRRAVVPARDAERGDWPTVSVVDRRKDDPRTGLYSEALVDLVHRVTAASGADAPPVVCVLHRTGRARLLACAACGELARCDRCGRALERVDDELSCRNCGSTRAVVCAACGATRLKVLRVGVSRVREELEALFKLDVTEVSGPARATGAERADDGELTAPTRLAVGTEAALHRVRRAAAVAFLDFDQHLLAPRFGASEESLALLARAGRMVGGRRGRADGGVAGTVLVQTRLPDHPVLAAAVRGDPSVLSAVERQLRAELDLPPATALALLSGEAAPVAADALASAGGEVLEISATGDGRWLVRAPDHRVLCDALSTMPRPLGSLRVAVDPTDL
jgi:primosomal protein N' (replication factor Y)